MTSKCLYGPPPSDSDESYDGFYFPEDSKREKWKPQVAPDQALYEAVLAGQVQTVSEEMKKLHFRVDSPVRAGHTMLMLACHEGHYELSEYLIKQCKATVNKQVDSVTPLMLACDCRRQDAYVAEKLVRLLLKHDAVINISDKYGMTPFMFACRSGFTSVVRLLIKDVSFDAVDNQGCTPIFHAIEKNHADIVKLLLEAGVNPHLANNKGYTPAQVAEFHGFYDLFELMPRPETKYLVPTQFLAYNSLSDQIPRIFLKTECPEYFQELNTILNSLNMSSMLEHFAKSRTSLAEFLIMDDQKLKEVGIEFPIYRIKIMKGILDFHLHHWSKKSIARVKKNGMDNFYEILLITANHLQHLIIIQASLRFVIQNQLEHKLGQPSDMQVASCENTFKAYRAVIQDITKTVQYLGTFSPPKSPLYIDYPEMLAERKRKQVRNYFKYTTIILGISVFICLKCKWFS